jgi:hypothetical protein
MNRVTATEHNGVVTIHIPVAAYGDAGRHWRDVLGGTRRRLYGRIHLQRYGAAWRRYIHTYSLRGVYSGDPADLDECPGAIFIWTGLQEPSVRAVFAHHNRALGSDMGTALRRFAQGSESDLWQVEFRFC